MSIKAFVTIATVSLLMLATGGAGCVIVNPLETFTAVEKVNRFIQDLRTNADVGQLQKDQASGRL